MERETRIMIMKGFCCCCLFILFFQATQYQSIKCISAILFTLTSWLQDGFSVFLCNIFKQFISETRNSKRSWRRIFCLTPFCSPHPISFFSSSFSSFFNSGGDKISRKPDSRLHLMLIGQNWSLLYTLDRDRLSDIKGYPSKPNTSKTYHSIYKGDMQNSAC